MAYNFVGNSIDTIEIITSFYPFLAVVVFLHKQDKKQLGNARINLFDIPTNIIISFSVRLAFNLLDNTYHFIAKTAPTHARMNHQKEKQQKTKSPTSISDWYANFMDKLSFACEFGRCISLDDVRDDISEFDQVSTYDERKERQNNMIRKHFASYDLPGDLEDNDSFIRRKQTDSFSLRRIAPCNSFLEEEDDDASREQAPMENTTSRDSLTVSVHKTILHPPPISPSNTHTTVSLTQSMERDDAGFYFEKDDDSVATTEIVSHLFRPKRKLPESNDDHEAYRYRYLFRMKPQNYIHSSHDEENGSQPLRSAFRLESPRIPQF